jgi:SOS-response transcriptional repressor LexA
LEALFDSLLPVNPVFEPITLDPEDARDLTIVGKFIGTIA